MNAKQRRVGRRRHKKAQQDYVSKVYKVSKVFLGDLEIPGEKTTTWDLGPMFVQGKIDTPITINFTVLRDLL